MIVALESVSLVRGGRALVCDASLVIEAGERVAVMGPNGAGKTTLLRLIAGLLPPDSGVARRTGVGIGYVPQAVGEHLFPWFSVLRNVAMPRLVARLPDALDVARALCARIVPGLDPSRRAGQLSGGEKQAISVARALAAPGQLVLADEPFSALSRAMRERVHRVLHEELGGRALVLVTHDPADAVALCDRALWMEEGRPTAVAAGA